MNMLDSTIRTCNTGDYIKVRSVLHCVTAASLSIVMLLLYTLLLTFILGAASPRGFAVKVVHVFLKGINHLWFNSSSLMGSSL